MSGGRVRAEDGLYGLSGELKEKETERKRGRGRTYTNIRHSPTMNGKMLLIAGRGSVRSMAVWKKNNRGWKWEEGYE